jgi:serine/threonine protein kinase
MIKNKENKISRFITIGNFKIPRYAKLYVVKDLPANNLETQKILDIEVRTLKKIKEKGCRSNILCMKEFYQEEDTVKIVTQSFEIGDGNVMNLKEFIKSYKKDKKYLKVENLLKIMYYIVDAIEKLHLYYNIGHNDLKPANIIINKKTFETQIIDFGLGCIKEIEECEIIGSPFYSEPFVQKIYQNGGKKNASEYSNKKLENKGPDRVKRVQMKDVYSIGKTFLELIDLIEPKDLDLYIMYEIKTIIREMMNENPNNRISIDRVLKFLKKRIKSSEINIFNYKIKQKNDDLYSNKYIKLKELGEGSFGKTFLCVERLDPKTKKNIIIRNLKGEKIEFYKETETKLPKKPLKLIKSKKISEEDETLKGSKIYLTQKRISDVGKSRLGVYKGKISIKRVGKKKS